MLYDFKLYMQYVMVPNPQAPILPTSWPLDQKMITLYLMYLFIKIEYGRPHILI